MARKRPQEPQPEDPVAPEIERIGPLALARHRKDDGRSLLLFSWAREDDDAKPADPAPGAK